LNIIDNAKKCDTDYIILQRKLYVIFSLFFIIHFSACTYTGWHTQMGENLRSNSR